MVKYENGKIYKLIDNTNGSVYVGSTAEPTLARRLAKHVSTYRSWLKDVHNYGSAFEILHNEDYKIILIEEYPCSSKDQLLQREQYWMDNMKCINKKNAMVSPEIRAKQKAQWRLNNRESTNEKKRELSAYCKQVGNLHKIDLSIFS